MLKIREANYEMTTGKDSDRHDTGRVSIRFSNARVAEFDGIRRDKFENWVATNFDPRQIPYDLALPLLGFLRTAGAGDEDELDDAGELDDDDDELEDEDDPDYIHELDFLGQETGYRTPGFPGYESEDEEDE